MYRVQAHRQQELLNSIQAVVTALLNLPAVQPPQPGETAELARRVRWVGMRTGDGPVVELQRDTDVPLERIAAQLPHVTTAPQVQPLRTSESESPRFVLVTLPDPARSLLVAAVVDRGSSISAARLDILLLAGGGAGLALLAAWCYFSLVIRRPVQRLAHWAATPAGQHTPAALDEPLPSELGALAQSLAELRGALQHWHQEACDLRDSIDLRVDAKTRRVMRELHRAERVAETDALTRLHNRRALQRLAPELFERCQLQRCRLACIVLDVDHFKLVNDTLGHAAGDELLRFLGELIRTSIRVHDLAFRYGGDEFLVLLPGKEPGEAREVAARIQALFAQRAALLSEVRPRPALSLGVAELREDGPATWIDLLQRADQAMYRRKKGAAAR